jgi:hypothetical protein
MYKSIEEVLIRMIFNFGLAQVNADACRYNYKSTEIAVPCIDGVQQTVLMIN